MSPAGAGVQSAPATTAAQEWRDYERANTRANRAYDTPLAELAESAIPLAERNRQKSARYYRTQTRKKN